MFAEFKRILYPVLVFRSMILANVRALWSGPFQALSASGRGNEVEGGGGGELQCLSTLRSVVDIKNMEGKVIKPLLNLLNN